MSFVAKSRCCIRSKTTARMQRQIVSRLKAGVVCFLCFLVSLSHVLAWPFELGVRVLTPWHGPWSVLEIRTPTIRCCWGYRVARFGVAFRVGDTDSEVFLWPVELLIRISTLLRGRFS